MNISEAPIDETGRRRSARLLSRTAQANATVVAKELQDKALQDKASQDKASRAKASQDKASRAKELQKRRRTSQQTKKTLSNANQSVTNPTITPKVLNTVAALRNARSLDINHNKYSNVPIRKYRSASLSPIYGRRGKLFLNTFTTPKEFLKHRLDVQKYLTTKDDNFFLNIQELLVKNIEDKATGIVCLSNNITADVNDQFKDKFKFAIKIAKEEKSDSDKEIYILKKMIEFIDKGYHNLPIIYKAFKINRSKTDLTSIAEINTFLKKYAKYNIYANELAKGDLMKILNLYNEYNFDISTEVLLNSIVQILLCIATLHNIGIRHNDTHNGNFLYHKIPAGGYFRYTIGDQVYYLKNLGYLWVIWDFGISTQLNSTMKCDYFYDYEMLSLFLRQDTGEYNMRFEAMNAENQVVRRLHGNLNFRRKIPKTIVKLTDKIYELSIDKRSNKQPNITIEEGNAMLSSKRLDDKTLLREISTPLYIVSDHSGKYIDEKSFLTDHILPIFESIFEDHVSNINTDDIVFDINLQFMPIQFKLTPDRKSDHGATIDQYKDTKIILKEEFYQTKK